MTERTLPVFLLVSALIVAGCVLLGVWWLSIPIVLVLLPGPFVTPAIIAKLHSRRSGARFQQTVRRPQVAFDDTDSQTLGRTR